MFRKIASDSPVSLAALRRQVANQSVEAVYRNYQIDRSYIVIRDGNQTKVYKKPSAYEGNRRGIAYTTQVRVNNLIRQQRDERDQGRRERKTFVEATIRFMSQRNGQPSARNRMISILDNESYLQETGREVFQMSLATYNKVFADENLNELVGRIQQNVNRIVGGRGLVDTISKILISEDRIVRTSYREIPGFVRRAAPAAAERMNGYSSTSTVSGPFVLPELRNAEDLSKAMFVKWSHFVSTNSRPKSCLFDCILHVFKDAIEESGRCKNLLKLQKLDYDGLRVIATESKYDPQAKRKKEVPVYVQNGGRMSFNQAVDCFFRPFHKALRVIDVFGRIVFGYHPHMDGNELCNKHAGPNFLNFLQHEDHVWVLNDQIKRLDAICSYDPETKQFRDVAWSVPVKNRVQFAEIQVEQHVLARSIDDIVRSLNVEGSNTKMYWRDPDLNDLLLDIVAAGHMPQVRVSRSYITEISIKTRNSRVTIKSYNTQSAEHNDSLLMIQDNETLQKYLKLRKDFEEVYMNPMTLSFYGKGVMPAFKAYRRTALVGAMSSYTDGMHVQKIDVRRAYTYAFTQMSHVPVLSGFDTWREYKPREEIKDMNLYLVEANSYTRKKYPIVYDKDRCIVYGSTLKRYPASIKYVLEPSRLVEVGERGNAVLEQIFASDLPDDFKKAIPNHCSGLLEKIRSRGARSAVFTEEMYALDLQKSLTVGQKKPSILNIDDKLFVVTASEEKELIEGFYPIKHWIYDFHRAYMQKLHDELQMAGLHPVAIKTDCLYVENDTACKLWMQENGSRFGNKPGMLKNEGVSRLSMMKPLHTEVSCMTPVFQHVPTIKQDVFTLTNEYSLPEFYTHFENKLPLLVTAEEAGSGKSYAIAQYCMAQEVALDAEVDTQETDTTFEKGTKYQKTLFVCPTNKRRMEFKGLGFPSCTPHRLFGMKVAGQERTQVLDVQLYDRIVFEEVGMYSVSALMKLKQFVNQYAFQKQIFANY